MCVARPHTFFSQIEKEETALFVDRARWQHKSVRVRPATRHELVCVRPYPLRCHWLRAAPKTRSRREKFIARSSRSVGWKYRALSRPARLEATLNAQDPNLVDVKTSGIVGFQIYVDPRVFDVERPLRVRVNGKAPTAHIIQPDIGALLDDYRERGDPGLLYVARLSFP